MKVNLPASRRAKSLSPPNCSGQVMNAFSSGIKSGQWAYGGSCQTLEAAIASELGIDPACVIVTASCSHALAAAHRFLGYEQGPGNGPVVNPLTWPATYGAESFGCEWADFDNYLLQLPQVDIAVDLWGMPAFRSGPVQIIDAAHRFLGEEHGPALQEGEAKFVTYSFALQKEISCFMGGALCFAEPAWRDDLLAILGGGIKDRVSVCRGVPKGLMPAPVARWVRMKMHEHSGRKAARLLVLNKYRELMGDRLLTDTTASGHLAVVLADDHEQRWEWRRNLHKHDVQFGWHYPLNEAQKKAAPRAADLSSRVVTLPLHCHQYVNDAVEVLRRMVGA